MTNSKTYGTAVISLCDYEKKLKEKNSAESVSLHIQEIKNQRITHLFYLPSHSILPEAIALLDHTCCISDLQTVLPDLQAKRIFTLSDFGFYLFLLKLSIHFTRVKEGVCRG